jgi:hypothetical protein
MSEYGCITNTRTFQEVAALYSDEMTAVFSGGLVYEYSNEGNGYGLVDISVSSSVVTTEQFTYLAAAFANTTNPTGNGDASASASSACPPQSDEWVLTTNTLPAMPNAAAKFMTTGAGTGPGLSGYGSQDAGTTETESGGTSSSSSLTTATTTSTASPSSTKKSDAVLPMTPISFLDLSPIGVVFVAMIGGMAML